MATAENEAEHDTLVNGETKEKTYTFDDIFDHVGHFGCYQFSLFVFGCVVETSAALTLLYIIFERANPGWTCAPENEVAGNWTVGSGNVTENVCPSENAKCQNLTYNDEFTSISTEWDLICDQKYMTRVTQSTFFAAVLVGAAHGGFLADTYGRKLIVMIMWVFVMLLQASTGLANVWAVYVTLRILAGICTGGLAAITMVISAEYLGPRYRSLPATRFGWVVGGVLIALLGYLLPNWRWHVAANGLIMFPFVPIVAIFMPESARWLLRKGRLKEAESILTKLGKYNGKDTTGLGHVLAKIAEDEVLREAKERAYSYLDLFSTRRYALMTFSVAWMWFSTSLVTYGITSNMSGLSGSIHLNVAISYSTIGVLRWTVIFVAGKIGRKKSFYLYSGFSLVCLVVVVILVLCNSDGSLNMAITAAVLVSYLGIGGMWALIFILPFEAFPTLIRSRSLAVGNVSARVGGILAPQVGLLTTIHPILPYLLYSVFGISTCVFVRLFMPETNGRPLPENIPPRKTKRKKNLEEGIVLDAAIKA